MASNVDLVKTSSKSKKKKRKLKAILTLKNCSLPTCHFLRMTNFFNLSVQILAVLNFAFLSDSHFDSRHCMAVRRFSFRCTSKLDMKSLASWDTASNESSSKSKSAQVILENVSTSDSPMKGDKPLNLNGNCVLLEKRVL